MKVLTKFNFGDEKKPNSTSFSSFTRGIEEVKKIYGVEEVFFWPEVYEFIDFDNMDIDDLPNTPKKRQLILVIGTPE